MVRVTTYGKAAPGEAVAHDDFKSLVKGATLDRAAKIVLELDAVGRDREGLSVRRAMRALEVENEVEVHIANGRSISTEVLGELRALRATIA